MFWNVREMPARATTCGITHRLGLAEVAFDREHIRAIGADNPPLASHLVDRQLGAEVAPQPLGGTGEREWLAGDHAPFHHCQPEPVDVDGGGGKEQPRE